MLIKQEDALCWSRKWTEVEALKARQRQALTFVHAQVKAGQTSPGPEIQHSPESRQSLSRQSSFQARYDLREGLLHVEIYLCICVCPCVLTYIHTYGGQRSMSGIFLNHAPLCFLISILFITARGGCDCGCMHMRSEDNLGSRCSPCTTDSRGANAVRLAHTKPLYPMSWLPSLSTFFSFLRHDTSPCLCVPGAEIKDTWLLCPL